MKPKKPTSSRHVHQPQPPQRSRSSRSEQYLHCKRASAASPTYTPSLFSFSVSFDTATGHHHHYSSLTTHTLPFPLLVDRLSTMSLFSVPLYWFPLFLDTFWFVSYFCPFYICYHFLWTSLLPPSSLLVQCYHKHVPINTADQTLTRWLHVFFCIQTLFFSYYTHTEREKVKYPITKRTEHLCGVCFWFATSDYSAYNNNTYLLQCPRELSYTTTTTPMTPPREQPIFVMPIHLPQQMYVWPDV